MVRMQESNGSPQTKGKTVFALSDTLAVIQINLTQANAVPAVLRMMYAVFDGYLIGPQTCTPNALQVVDYYVVCIYKLFDRHDPNFERIERLGMTWKLEDVVVPLLTAPQGLCWTTAGDGIGARNTCGFATSSVALALK